MDWIWALLWIEAFRNVFARVGNHTNVRTLLCSAVTDSLLCWVGAVGRTTDLVVKAELLMPGIAQIMAEAELFRTTRDVRNRRRS